MTNDAAYPVLIVDDEYLIRSLLKGTVPWEEEGFRVEAEADCAEAALELVAARTFRLAVVDICMPRMDGIEFASRAKEIDPDLPVVILSGHDTTEYARRSIRAGVWDYLLKPVCPEEIRAALQRVRRRLESAFPRPRPLDADAAKSWGVLDEVRGWLHERLEDPNLSLRRAAEEFLLNPSYLSRRFKQAFGVSFVEYVMEQRVRRAMELARASDVSGYEIGRAVGIPDAHYFSIVFKKYAGKTFSAYRGESRC